MRRAGGPIAMTAMLILVAACGSHKQIRINGAGSTFDDPLFEKAFAAYAKDHNVQVNYQALGSGTGQTYLDQKTVQFGAYDVPIGPADNLSSLPKLVQFPVALGGVSILYNLPDYSGQLRLTGALLAQIYMKQITTWSDPKLTALNPGLSSLAGKTENSITVVHRSDSSGTSYIFTDFLTRTSPAWASAIGASKAPAWPVGEGGVHSAGVQALVNPAPGAIGYVEVAYAIENPHQGVGQAYIQNAAGVYLKPTLGGVAADAAQAGTVSPSSFSIVNAAGVASYPISGFSWVGLYKTFKPKDLCSATVDLFKWLVTSGQKYGPSLDYVKLPAADAHFAASQLRSVRCTS